MGRCDVKGTCPLPVKDSTSDVICEARICECESGSKTVVSAWREKTRGSETAVGMCVGPDSNYTQPSDNRFPYEYSDTGGDLLVCFGGGDYDTYHRQWCGFGDDEKAFGDFIS